MAQTPTWELQQAIDHAQRLTDRRLKTSAFYLTAVTGLSAIVPFVHDQDSSSSFTWGTIFTLSLLAIAVSLLWHRLISNYSKNIAWWYTEIRRMEQTECEESNRLFTLEYETIYRGGVGSFSQFERLLATCTAFGFAILALFSLSQVLS